MSKKGNWNSFAGSGNAKRQMTAIQIQVNNIALKSIERHTRPSYGRQNNRLSLGTPNMSTMSTLDELIGSACQNNGCSAVAVCADACIVDTECQHHRGTLVSDKQVDNNAKLELEQQYWSCCGRMSTNLLGCAVDKHRWVKRERDDNVRHDWFYRAGLVHLSIFCRSAVPQGTRVESDGLKLNVTVAHAFGKKETVKHFDLYADIVPSESVLLISEKKVELILKQQKREQWPSLTYQMGDGAIHDEDDMGDGAFFVDDDEGEGHHGNAY